MKEILMQQIEEKKARKEAEEAKRKEEDARFEKWSAQPPITSNTMRQTDGQASGFHRSGDMSGIGARNPFDETPLPTLMKKQDGQRSGQRPP